MKLWIGKIYSGSSISSAPAALLMQSNQKSLISSHSLSQIMMDSPVPIRGGWPKYCGRHVFVSPMPGAARFCSVYVIGSKVPALGKSTQGITIRFYQDRLEIGSPGGFIGGITPDNILTHEPRRRNRLLAEALQHIGAVNRMVLASIGCTSCYLPMEKRPRNTSTRARRLL